MAKNKKEEVIEIKPIKIKTTKITIKGVSSLIVSNFNEKCQQQILDAQMKKTKEKVARNPMEDFIRAFNWLTPMPEEFTEEAFDKALKEGARFGFPSTGIKQSVVSGAFRNDLTKDKVSLNGAFFIPDEFIEIKYEEIKMRQDYVRIAHGGTDVRFRPEFKNWSMTFEIQYNENKYSLSQIINFFNYGGFSCGLGEWRTEKGGNFGSYRVETE